MGHLFTVWQEVVTIGIYLSSDLWATFLALKGMDLSGPIPNELPKQHINRSYKLNTSRIAYAYKESLVYPYVDFEVKGDNYILHNEEYTDVLLWIEKYGLVHIQWLKIALCSFIFVVVPNFMYAHLIWFAFSHKFSTFLARENSDK